MIKVKENIKTFQKILQINRIRILIILDKEETCACTLVSKLKLPNNLVSHHLKVLSDIGLLQMRKAGLHRRYSIVPTRRQQIKKMLKCLQTF